ncbi:B-box domain protein 31 [Linum grandiflorum]
MKRCELCKSLARTFCESDQASLCWSCDAKVHGANFLVARHSRTLLCHFCQCPTPWQAAGAKLGHTVSFCLRCANGDTHEGEAGEEEDEVESGSEEEELEEEEEEDEDDLGDNQVVPWSSSDSTPPPPAESSSSFYSSDSDGGESVVSTKRRRESCLDLCCLLQDDINRRSPSASQYCSVDDTARPTKNRRTEQAVLRSSSRSTAIVVRLDPVSQNGVGFSGGEKLAVDEGETDDSSDNSSRTI